MLVLSHRWAGSFFCMWATAVKWHLIKSHLSLWAHCILFLRSTRALRSQENLQTLQSEVCRTSRWLQKKSWVLMLELVVVKSSLLVAFCQLGTDGSLLSEEEFQLFPAWLFLHYDFTLKLKIYLSLSNRLTSWVWFYWQGGERVILQWNL